MPTALEKLLTATQRAAEAARQAGGILALTDAKALAAALAEAALEGVRRNPSFAAHVRRLYDEVSAHTKPGPKRTSSRRAAPDVELAPRAGVEVREANPGVPPETYYLHDLYGADQLPIALARYKLPELKLAVELVQGRNPGTAPTNRGSRDAIIAYIVWYVAR